MAAAWLQKKHGLQIDAVNRIPVIFGNFENRHLPVDRRIVNQPVELTVGRVYVPEELLNFRNTSQVGLECLAATFVGCLLSICLGMAVVDGYLRALFGEAEGNGPTDPPGRASHKNDFPIELILGYHIACSNHGRSPLLPTNITGSSGPFC